MDFKESGFMYALGGFIVVFVLAQSLFFLIRAWKQGKKLGLSTAIMRGTVTQSALFSLAPAISIVATILTLSGALGIVLPWIRLTVIGAISYEVPAAESAMEALGYTGGLSAEITDPLGFSTAAWVMTLGSVMPLVIIPFAMKKIQNSIGKAVSKNTAWADVMSAAAFIGLISAFVGRAIVGQGDKAVLGDGAGIMSITALAVSMLSMLLFMQIEKKKKIAWLQSMAMPLAMFIGMGAVMLLANVLPFWVISALFIFLMLPVAISAHLHAFPSAQVVFKGLAPIALLFYPTAVIEVMTYTPLLGTGATYLAFVTGNINNLKLPCVLSALDSAQVRAQSKEGEVLSTIACATSSIVTTLVIAAGVLLFSPVLPYLTNDDSVFAPAFKQVVPALFGALGMSYFAKHFKLTVVPVAVVCLMLLFKGDLAVGVLIPVGVVVSLLSAHLMFKKGWVK